MLTNLFIMTLNAFGVIYIHRPLNTFVVISIVHWILCCRIKCSLNTCVVIILFIEYICWHNYCNWLHLPYSLIIEYIFSPMHCLWNTLAVIIDGYINLVLCLCKCSLNTFTVIFSPLNTAAVIFTIHWIPMLSYSLFAEYLCCHIRFSLNTLIKCHAHEIVHWMLLLS